MIDWFTSKMAMTFTAIALIAAAFAYFDVFAQDVDANKLDAVAFRIADAVNDVNSVEVDVLVNITSNPGTHPGVQIPGKISDRTYEIYVSTNYVSARLGKSSQSSDFVRSVHIGNPEDITTDGSISKEDLNSYDIKNNHQIFNSGTTFVIHRKMILVDGAEEYHTFIY